MNQNLSAGHYGIHDEGHRCIDGHVENARCSRRREEIGGTGEYGTIQQTPKAPIVAVYRRSGKNKEEKKRRFRPLLFNCIYTPDQSS